MAREARVPDYMLDPEAAAGDLTLYGLNPVVLWAHDMTRLPIGIAAAQLDRSLLIVRRDLR